METATLQPTGLEYPEAVQRLEGVPEHIVDQIGDIALKLSHADMHPTMERPNEYGNIETVKNLESKITDADYDSSTLEADAIELAEQGKQKVASILDSSSKLLKEAHSSLEESGVKFGTDELETDEQRNSRESREKEDIYSTAYQQAIENAVEAKKLGDTASVEAAMESLVLLRYVHGKYEHPELRNAVRAGLSNELIAAAQTADALYVGTGYDTVSSSIHPAYDLLSFATGKKLNSYGRTFRVEEGEPMVYTQASSDEGLKDIIAAMASPEAWLDVDKGFEALRGSTVASNLKSSIDGGYGSIEYFDSVLERNADPKIINEVLKCTDPNLFLDAMDQLGIKEAWKVVSILGRPTGKTKPNSYEQMISIDPANLQGLVAIKNAYPDHYNNIVENNFEYAFSANSDGFDANKIISGLGVLTELGMDSPLFLKQLISTPDGPLFESACKGLETQARAIGMNVADVLTALPFSLKNFQMLMKTAIDNPDQLPNLLSDIQYQSEIGLEYKRMFGELDPKSKDVKVRPDPEKLKHLASRIESSGVPSAVAAEIIKSWGTYQAYAQKFFNYEELAIIPPGDSIDESMQMSLVNSQLLAFESQLKALETFTSTYGKERTQQVVKIFGIYNFGRHDPDKLNDQLTRWEAGEQVQTTVVDARSDWNSFTTKSAVFEEEVGAGVFYFEANSGADTARVAVQIGKHERSHDRTPDTKRFIIHAHANNEGLGMGVNGEKIELQAYKKAAENASKINAKEVNDFKRHLGPNFEVQLQGCSTAKAPVPVGSIESSETAKDIAETMRDRHDTQVTGAVDSINTLIVHNDGTVTFKSGNSTEIGQVTYPRQETA